MKGRITIEYSPYEGQRFQYTIEVEDTDTEHDVFNALNTTVTQFMSTYKVSNNVNDE